MTSSRDRSTIPLFLSQRPEYLAYRYRGAEGSLTLPAYKKESAGCTIIYYGEIFCRFPGCKRGRKGFPSTSALRSHVTNQHNMITGPQNSGSITEKMKEEAKAWYCGLVATHDTDMEGEGNEDKDRSDP
ncbi:hypothetical protein N7456_007368 [Penicillium angulare]|uniref:Uncharacterized protein n=1 Tax=Penicillium angulare TaxID=116970 RepID=A0A9W9K959_9EURO|nr:hypothetical protein N7456_007368 [Penicillium angulare]